VRARAERARHARARPSARGRARAADAHGCRSARASADLLFIPLLGFPGQVFAWGAVEPAGAVFISGLPGGISYFMLGCLKLGWLDALLEKRVTANLNAWVRLPGILVNTFIVYQAMLYGRHTLPLWAMALHVVLPPYNGVYYCKQSSANYTVHFLTTLLQQDEGISKRRAARARGH
jgi:hypothetical protein